MDEGGPSGLFVGDEPSQDSDDNISLTSTVPEEEQVFYHVEEILCEGERELDGAPMWLVKWSGYPLTQATFEPRENFTSSSTIEEWEIKRKAIDGGKEPAFDLDQWVQDVEAEKRATAERKRKRQEKRRALQANAAGLRKRPSSSNRTPRKGLATKRIRKESDEPSDDLGPAERRRKLTNTSSALPAISENNDDGNTSSNKVREPARQVTVIDPPPRPSSATAKATERSVAANPVSSNQSIGTSGPSTGPSQRPAPMAPMRRPASASSNYTMFGGKAPTTATAKRSSNSASTNQKVTVMTNDPSARRKSATRTAGPGASTGYRNLQHQHRARKRNQEEQAPNFDDLRTFNPGERRTAVNRLPAESDAGNLATDSAQGTVTPNTVIANTVIPSTVTPNPATASTTKEPSARNTPPTDTISKPPPMPLTTSSTGAIASTSAAKGPLIRKRSNSQLNVGNLSLNATESRSTAMAQDAIESGDTFPTRAPMATMVSSTRSTQTQGGPALEPSQPKTQLTMTQHVEAQPSGVQLRVDTPGDGIRIDPHGLTCRRWLKGIWHSEDCPFGATCRYYHHYCAKVEPKGKGQCEHWKNDNCRYSDELCGRWHAEIDPRTGEPPNVSSSYNDIEHILRTMPPVARSSTTGHGPVPPQTTYVPIQSSTTVGPKPKSKSGTVCRFWFQGKCTKSPCFRAHYRCDKIEAKTPRVCNYWRTGYCRRTDAECQFYHQEFDGAGRPVRERRFETCPNWKVSTCSKGEDQCEYYHVYWDPFSQQHDPADVGISTDADGFMDIDDIDDDEPGLFHDTSTSTPGVVSTTQSIPLPQPADEPSLPPAQPSLPSEPSRSLSLPLPASHTPRVPTSGSDEEVFMNEMIVKLCEAQLQLKSERLFTGSKGMVFDKVVCLMFPPSQVAEITLITRYLQAIGATVVNPEIPGSWRAYIRKIRDMSKSGVILYHPSIFNYHQMYNFRHTLLNGYINHFQLGIDAALQDHPQAKTVYSCIRLFPHGDLVLLPDDLLFHEPAKALQIVQAFYANLKLKPIGGRNARLVFRPGVREVLAKLKLREDEQATRIELWRTIEEMYKKFERMKFPGSMQPKHVNIVSQPIQFAPKYAALWEEDQAKATNWLVDWFAGWCLSQRERFRRFHIIASDDKGETANRWLRHYQHVVVSSPEKYLLRYKKR